MPPPRHLNVLRVSTPARPGHSQLYSGLTTHTALVAKRGNGGSHQEEAASATGCKDRLTNPKDESCERTEISKEDDKNKNEDQDIETMKGKTTEEAVCQDRTESNPPDMSVSTKGGRPEDQAKATKEDRKEGNAQDQAEATKEGRTDSNSPTPEATQSVPKNQPIPVVAWAECCDCEDGTECNHSCSCVPVTTYRMFSRPHTARQRPHTATPKVLVSPRHSAPLGLSQDDVICGTRIPPKSSKDFSLHGDSDKEQSSRDAKVRPLSWHSANSKSISDEARLSTMRRPNTSCCFPSQHKEIRSRRLVGRLSARPRTSPHKTEMVSLDLTITALSVRGPAPGDRSDDEDGEEGSENDSFSGQGERSADRHTDKHTDRYTDRHTERHINRKPDRHTDRRSHSVLGDTDTIAGIKRSYSRAQSAPLTRPRHSSFRISNVPTKSPSLRDTHELFTEDGKKLSNPYWRARSAYHKRQTDLEGLESGGEDAERAMAQLRGSLLRPLLYHDDAGALKHSAGCPYKCKGCFKACLASSDYIEEAKRSQRTSSTFRNLGSLTKSTTQHQSKAYQSLNPFRRQIHPDYASLVTQALARSQPIFRTVYGDRSGDTRIQPWPKKEWVDLKDPMKTSGAATNNQASPTEA